MATKVTFDGPNLLVIIKSGVTSIDFGKEIYSAYKVEVLSGVGDDLSKFPRLFLSDASDQISVGSIGGNDFGGGKNLGKFFIMNNVEGWRIRPAEEHAEVVIDGNLYPLDPGTPFTVPTVGAFTSRLVLQRSIDAIEIQTTGGASSNLVYGNAVWIDLVNGSPGTIEGFNGTPTDPVDNIADAVTLDATLKYRQFNIRTTGGGQITLASSHAGVHFVGLGGEVDIDLNGQDVAGALFNGCSISGLMNGRVSAVRCNVESIGDLDGVFSSCSVNGAMTAADGAVIQMDHCSSQGGVPVIDFQAAHAGSIRLDMQVFGGDIEIRNMDNAGDAASVNMSSGKVVLGATNSDGAISVRGTGAMSESATGTAVDVEGLVVGSTVEGTNKIAKALVSLL